MPFTTDLKTDWVEDTSKLILEEELRYYDRRSRQLFCVPTGFVSDGASIPRFLWSVMGHPFQSLVRKPSILHDFIYRNNVVKRKVADQIFYDALVEEGMGQNKAQLYYAAVRVGGSAAYKRGSEICDFFIQF